ncbi:putative Ras GTPase-activating-like protein ngap [Choanephora cucurbitarum]|uniref:Putative Ras GTPase-activating-like protein ngap n=1 Tax=Choanephora cucurbitarum TaxID=101091 RepID=A0A1C7NHE0_9FUNG|nr:putative Ras GTPase-activating-like protein ngap [Choanephora cucurbitarum]
MQTEKVDNTFFHLPLQLGSLSTQDIYPFSDSINQMKYCIVIRSKPSETYHLLTASKLQRDTWIHRLKSCCKSDGSSKFLLSGIDRPLTNTSSKTMCSLSIRIAEARKLLVSHKDSDHNEMYCDIVVDHEIRGLTGSSRKSPTVSWKEEFHFSDTAKIKNGLTINIYTKNNKNDRESLYGMVCLPISRINTGYTMQEEWYEIRRENKQRTFASSLASLGTSNISYGQIRIGVLLEQFEVYSLDYYRPLINALAEFRHDIIYEIARKSSDLQTLAKCLLRIYEGMGMTLTWIKSLIDYEVSCLNTDDVNTLFRGNSFFTKVLDNYMRMSGKEFLEEALQHTIEKICKFGLHIEVEPSRIKNFSQESALANCSKLFVYVRALWEDIEKAKFKCPIELRRIFGHLQAAIVRKFNLSTNTLDRQHQLARYTCVSGFVFLRWICPAIISPKLFGLVQDHPDTKTCRTLTLIAKCLMTLASHSSIEQTAREPWMVLLNEFVQSNTHQFINFINFISVRSFKRDDTLAGTSTQTKQEVSLHFIDLALELAQFSSWCLHECNTPNLITYACQSIHQRDTVDYRKKSRPKPWRYGDGFLTKGNETYVCSPSVAK